MCKCLFIATFSLLMLTGWNCRRDPDRVPVPLLEPVDYVDPFIGTGSSTTSSEQLDGVFSSTSMGQTIPAVGHPFGMTVWTPQTRISELKCISPYYYEDRRLIGFRGSHWLSGSCMQDYGSVSFMPLSGSLRVLADDRATRFEHGLERATPYTYSVELPSEKIRVEITASQRAGFLRFQFNEEGAAHVVVHPNSDEGVGFVEIHPDQNEIIGYNPVHRIYQGRGKPAGFKGYFVAVFDTPFSAYGTWDSLGISAGSLQAEGDSSGIGAYVSFDRSPGQWVQVKVGTSFTSIEGARKNLADEIADWDFEAITAASRTVWNRQLSTIRITSEDAASLVQFYTALYHSMQLPRVVNDVDGRYVSFAGGDSIYIAEGFDYYGDFSIWDTYRALHPLLALLEPERTNDMVRSLVVKADQGGWLPVFPAWNSYTSAMIGDHALSIITDAYLKGITDIDAEKAYRYMVQNATRTPPLSEYLDGKGRRALQPYLRYHYLPLEAPVLEAPHRQEQVSRTLEYAYDDFTLGVFASVLDKTEDARQFFERAAYYRNVIDPEIGFARGRYADGSWYAPFDPAERGYFFITEGSPWVYTWYAPHDVAGLIEHLGGRERFVAKLDSFFEERAYWHGNEPSHQIPYLYAYAGAPWKSQQWIRKILDDEYGTEPGGLPGNEDAGQMSAWYIFSTLGFYPVSPGLPMYVIGTPGFEEATLFLGNRVFTIRAPGVSLENRFIQSAELNGLPLTRTWIRHDEITSGGELLFEMGSTPNPAWGSGPKDAPPSLSDRLDALLPVTVRGN